MDQHILECRQTAKAASDSPLNRHKCKGFKGFKSRPFLTGQSGVKCVRTEFAARLAAEKHSWNLGCRLPTIKAKAGVEDVGFKCKNDMKKVGSSGKWASCVCCPCPRLQEAVNDTFA